MAPPMSRRRKAASTPNKVAQTKRTKASNISIPGMYKIYVMEAHEESRHPLKQEGAVHEISGRFLLMPKI